MAEPIAVPSPTDASGGVVVDGAQLAEELRGAGYTIPEGGVTVAGADVRVYGFTESGAQIAGPSLSKIAGIVAAHRPAPPTLPAPVQRLRQLRDQGGPADLGQAREAIRLLLEGHRP